MSLYRWSVAVAATALVAAAMVGQGTYLQALGGQDPETPAGRGQAPAGRGQAQAPAAIKNPLEGNPDAIRTGTETYRARCASCHGADAKGTARASDLTGVWAAGATDRQLFQSIRVGVPNTLIAHSFGPDNDVWPVLAYLRSVNGSSGDAAPKGDVANGTRVFGAMCSSCHIVNGQGGVLGPNLTRVGSFRSRPLLAHKIRYASTFFTVEASGGYVNNGYQPVTIVTRDGRRIRGIKKNESAFDIQIMDTTGRIQGYTKDSLREQTNETTSLMPSFGPDRLNDGDLNDLLAYLGTLRAPDANRR